MAKKTTDVRQDMPASEPLAPQNDVIIAQGPEVTETFVKPLEAGPVVLEPVENSVFDRHDRPGDYVGLDTHGSGVYAYEHIQAGKARRLTINGVNYEHVETDADDVWLYRSMD